MYNKVARVKACIIDCCLAVTVFTYTMHNQCVHSNGWVSHNPYRNPAEVLLHDPPSYMEYMTSQVKLGPAPIDGDAASADIQLCDAFVALVRREQLRWKTK
jgi:hypothetical protein